MLLVGCVLGPAFAEGLPAPPTEISDVLRWEPLPPLPDPQGFAGAYVGVAGDALLVAGGANFPGGRPWDGAPKVWYDDVFVLPAPDKPWRTGWKLPRPLGYGVSLSTDQGVICQQSG